MVKGRAWVVALAVGALVFSTAAIYQSTGGATLTVSMKGFTQAESYNPQKYQFNLSNSASVDLSGAAAGELSGDKFVNAFKDLFGKSPEGGGSAPTISGSIKGTKEGDKVSLTGKITVAWSVQGGKGKKQLEADLKGTMSAGGGNVSLKGENVKVSGTWNWGGGGMPLKGEGTLDISSK